MPSGGSWNDVVVAKQRKRRTFVVPAAEVAATPPRPRSGPHSVRPGRFNGANDLFDPQGHLVVEEAEVVDPSEALRHLEAGALVAQDVCGCGGHLECQPTWYSAADRRRMVAAGAPRGEIQGDSAWIDFCRAGERTVLFLHGDIVWGDVTS